MANRRSGTTETTGQLSIAHPIIVCMLEDRREQKGTKSSPTWLEMGCTAYTARSTSVDCAPSDAVKDEPAGDYVIPIGPAGDANPQTASARPAANKRCKLPIGASVDRWLVALDRPLFCLLPTFFLLCASKSLVLAHCAKWLLHLPPKHSVWAYQMAPPVGDQPDFWPPRLPDQKVSLPKDFRFELELIVW